MLYRLGDRTALGRPSVRREVLSISLVSIRFPTVSVGFSICRRVCVLVGSLVRKPFLVDV